MIQSETKLHYSIQNLRTNFLEEQRKDQRTIEEVTNQVNEFQARCQASTQIAKQNLDNIDLFNKSFEMRSDDGPSNQLMPQESRSPKKLSFN